jgi:hypothetical protein
MGHPRHLKDLLPMGAHFHGAIHEGIKALRSPALRPHLGKAQEGPPPFRKEQLKLMGLPPRPFNLQGHGGKGQEAMVTVEMAGADGEFRGLDGIADLQGGQVVELHKPARGCHTPSRKALLALPHLQALQVAHVIANEIGTRGPARASQVHAWLPGLKAEQGADEVLLRCPEVEAEVGCQLGVSRRGDNGVTGGG